MINPGTLLICRAQTYLYDDLLAYSAVTGFKSQEIPGGVACMCIGRCREIRPSMLRGGVVVESVYVFFPVICSNGGAAMIGWLWMGDVALEFEELP